MTLWWRRVFVGSIFPFPSLGYVHDKRVLAPSVEAAVFTGHSCCNTLQCRALSSQTPDVCAVHLYIHTRL